MHDPTPSVGEPQMTSPSYLAADTSVEVAERTVGDLLRECAADSGDVVAMIEVVPAGGVSLSGVDDLERRWTYQELLHESETCASWLLDHFAPGDRIVIWAPNIPEWVILEYGAALAGLVVVTVNPGFGADELKYVLDQSGAAALFHVSDYRGRDMTEVAREAARVDMHDGAPALFSFADWPTLIGTRRGPRADLPDVHPSDPAQIQYTSGTTGVPKAAVLHHRGLVNNADFFSQRAQFTEGCAVVSAMPLFHTAGSGMSVLGCAHRRATYCALQYFDPVATLEAVQRLRARILFGVPTMLIAILNDPDFDEFDLTSCAVTVSGGSSVPPELVRRIETELQCRFSTVYGQTELSPIITQTSPDDSVTDKAETVGRPLPQVEIKIADPLSFDPVPRGRQGEICARGYQMMLGYKDMPEATAATIDHDGWLHTGDLGTMDSRGYLRVTGRIKDMIIRGGENIYPAEIEEVLFAHPSVIDVAVVGIPDEYWGEQVGALLLLNPDAPTPLAEDLETYCRQRLARHKIPQHWFWAGEFPLTGSGKIQKHRIQASLRDQQYQRLN